MDVEQLHIVLQQSFSPDVNLRGPAEETIRNLKHIKAATVLLLQVAAEKQVSRVFFFARETTPHGMHNLPFIGLHAITQAHRIILTLWITAGSIRSTTSCVHSA
jgi:hypothetical protein